MKKLEVVASYLELQEVIGGAHPSIIVVAQECKVSRHYVRTVEKELHAHGTIMCKDNAPSRGGARGFGSRSLDRFDVFVLITLYHEEPSQSLNSYTGELA